jgi:hypothetical protein
LAPFVSLRRTSLRYMIGLEERCISLLNLRTWTLRPAESRCVVESEAFTRSRFTRSLRRITLIPLPFVAIRTRSPLVTVSMTALVVVSFFAMTLSTWMIDNPTCGVRGEVDGCDEVMRCAAHSPWRPSSSGRIERALVWRAWLLLRRQQYRRKVSLYLRCEDVGWYHVWLFETQSCR